PTWAMLTLGALVAGNLVYGWASLRDLDDTVAHTDRSIRVGLVQANMGIYAKRQDPAEGLRRHREQSLEVIRQGADIVIWPELAYSYPLSEGIQNVAAEVHGPGVTQPLIFGGVRTERLPGAPERRLYNSALLADGAGNL